MDWKLRTTYSLPQVHAPFTIVPFWDARGNAPVGVFSTGVQTLCDGPAPTQACVAMRWPWLWTSADRQRSIYGDYWQGTLLESKRDKSGFGFLRNRYYDPVTGRFTQEDPIGLDGGLNLYGFASGDAVNFADPFGLCPLVMKILSPSGCKAFDSRREAEQRALLRHGYGNARTAGRIFAEAVEIANRQFPKGAGKPNGLNDAYKHAYGSCRLTQEADFATAKDLGDAHEVVAGNPPNSRKMDLANNARGRSIGMDKDAGCGQGVTDALNAGKLWVQEGGDTNGELEPSDPETSPP
jgi:RHS repeat-associated protein